MLDAYIYDGLRTPFGRHAGALAPVRPDDLLASVISTLVNRNDFPLEKFEDVVAGNTNQAGEDARNVARHAGLLAGLPDSVAGVTVNRLCGSGLAATLDAARMVTVNEGDLVIAAGVESMSRAPFVMAKAESPYSRNMKVFDSTIGARFPNPRILKEFGADTMPETAHNVAAELGISREEADAYAAQSQARYEAARADGFFKEEIMPVEVPQGRKKPPLVVDADEHPRPGTGAEQLAKLPAIVEGGIITAGNASGVNDGAAALRRSRRYRAARPHHRWRRGRGGTASHGPGSGGRLQEGAGSRRSDPQGHGRDRNQRSLRRSSTGLLQATGPERR
ncbi:acetyl-CoA acetyltransferase [Alcanivorax xiamenensis]|uniref:Acetyl-CoA acetyltransferase n=1 Tax=Alcanivorax xiamenensis TaxID=1177156 RepID=A0ABQ6Y2A9_9GAMM|nr:acetyl-CoA acetyltransferase [Alcanivorax xiamenensis]